MKKATRILLLLTVAAAFVFGVTVGHVAAKKAGVTSAAWQGTPEKAAAHLLDIAEELAENDSWQNIHLARVRYLSGDKDRAEVVFDRYRGGKKADAGNLVRIARAYAHAGDWDKARPLYDQILEMNPKDEDWLAEAGAFYNLNGDRATAEALFERSFRSAPKAYTNILTAAGSYVGVAPRKR